MVAKLQLPILTLLLVAVPAGAQAPAYRDATRSTDERAADLLRRMTIEEKFWQLFMIPGSLDDPAHDYTHGVFGLQIGTRPDSTSRSASQIARAHAQRINAIQQGIIEQSRLGIPIVPFDEALHGLTRDGATMFPQAIALAATWDTALVGRVATAIARETASRGIRQVLSPVVNIATDARWGRVEETYGEDPYLVSTMTRAFVRAFEANGIITTPKHFVANVGEGGRDSYPIDDSRRRLEEIHFPPFRAALDEGARSIMTAYNSVDGSPASQSRFLLTDILERAWRFNGFVISDAAATGGATVLHMTEASTTTAARDAIEAGLHVIFQSSWEQHRSWLQAFRSGTIDEARVDSAVARVLRAKLASGLFERPYTDADSAAYWNGNPEHRALALEAAHRSIVLLRNENAILPLDGSLRSVAVIGTDAVEARLGGYSGPGNRPVSILDGIRERLGSRASVTYSPGPGRVIRDLVIVPADRFTTRVDGRDTAGLTGEYFDNNRLGGAPRIVRIDRRLDFQWTLNSPGRGIPLDWYSVRWTGTLTVPDVRVHRLGVEGNDGYRVWLDDRLIIDNWTKRSAGRRIADVDLGPGSSHALRVEYFESTGNARVRLVWDAGVDADQAARIDQAVTAARMADATIIVAGIEEGEFRDRASLSLPGRQEELIEAVAQTGRPVVVVIVGGSAVTMSRWLDRVDGVLLAWYPGEAGGHAVADVLFGDVDPGGRLPMTWPIAEGQLPLVYNHKPTGRGDDYLDLTGHPLFPFGYGLSYTTFEYSDLGVAPASIGPAGSAIVSFRVRNTGSRAGDEVAQLYIRDVLASVARPIMQLAGFRRVHLEPGQQTEITVTIDRKALELLDRDLNPVVEPGAFRIMVGGSSRDIRLRGELIVR